ncbi:MAG: lysine 5,6-aminomutase subunit alpha, partial [Desulfobacteraceae bacterium]
GRIQKRAEKVLEDAVAMLEDVAQMGLMAAISKAMFADIARTREGGKGLSGVIPKQEGYSNPFEDLLREGG